MKKGTLNEEQAKRLLIALETLKDKNQVAGLIWTALGKKPAMEDKKKILAVSYAQCYEMMLSMNMAIASKVKADVVAKRLHRDRPAPNEHPETIP